MFLPTKAHQQVLYTDETNGISQHRVRIGARAPKGAVNLAYSAVPALTPSQNLNISDTSGFVLENLQANDNADMVMYPDETHLLLDRNGSDVIPAEIFLITNVLKNSVPMYFVHQLRWPMHDSKGPDYLGNYQGKAISVIDRDDNLVDPATYRIMLVPANQTNYYHVLLFTSFQVAPEDNTRVIYTAYVTDYNTASPISKNVPATIEIINPQPAFRIETDLNKVMSGLDYLNLVYYKTNGPQMGMSKVYIPNTMIEDTRTPVMFQYRLYAKNSSGQTAASSPWLWGKAYNLSSATVPELSTFSNGNQILCIKNGTPMTAQEVITSYAGPLASGLTYYIQQKANAPVSLYTSLDGQGEILATVNKGIDTGSLSLPDTFMEESIDQSLTFDVSVKFSQGGTLLPYEGPRLQNYEIWASEGEKAIKTLNPAEWKLPANFDPTTWQLGFFLDENIPITLTIYDTTNEVYPVDSNGNNFVSYSALQSGSISLHAKIDTELKKFRPGYSIKFNGSKQIKPLPPREQSPFENWYVRVQNGYFMKKTFETEGANKGLPVAYTYMLPEYFRQCFDKSYGVPYMQVVNEKAKVTGTRQVKVKNTPLFIDYDIQNETVKNITVMVNGYEATIIDWNVSDGSILIDTAVQDADDILVTYYYEETSFPYRGYLNDTLQKFIHLDCNPGYGHLYSKIIGAGEYAEVQELPSFRLINETIYLFLRPASKMSNVIPVKAEPLNSSDGSNVTLPHAAIIDDPGLQVYSAISGTVLAKWDMKTEAVPPASAYWYVNATSDPNTKTFTGITIMSPSLPEGDYWVIDYTYQTDTYQIIPNTFQQNVLYHNFDGVQEGTNDILLAKIQVRPNSSQSSVRIIDTRTRGGGLLEEIGEAIRKEVDPESEYYWDIGYWDGEPYQENAVVVIRLSNRLLKEYGGLFTKEEINQSIEKWIAFGTFYIVEFVDESDRVIETPQNVSIDEIVTNLADDTTVNVPVFDLTTVDVDPTA